MVLGSWKRVRRGAALALGGAMVLAGCNLEWSAGTGSGDTEVSLRMPEEPTVEVTSVLVVIEAVTLQSESGSHEVALEPAVTVELVSEIDDQTPPAATVFSGQELPAGDYASLTLAVDESRSSVTTAGGASRDLSLAGEGEALTFEAPFTVSADGGDEVVLDVDLPAALRSDGDDYTLHPEGVVTTASRSGLVLFPAFPACGSPQGRGVYLYPGFDASPGSMGSGNGPLFSLRVGPLSSFTLAYMPVGQYTAAWTCDADADDPDADDGIEFEGQENLEVEAGACTLVELHGGRGDPGSC